MSGEAFHIAASLAIAGAVIWAFDWTLRNMPEALDEEAWGEVVEVPEELKARRAADRNSVGLGERDLGGPQPIRTSDIAHRNGVFK